MFCGKSPDSNNLRTHPRLANCRNCGLICIPGEHLQLLHRSSVTPPKTRTVITQAEGFVHSSGPRRGAAWGCLNVLLRIDVKSGRTFSRWAAIFGEIFPGDGAAARPASLQATR